MKSFARTDANDLLLSADEPLAGLQRRCGGTVPGVIAIPELRDLVNKARVRGLKLGQVVCAQDGSDEIATWVDITPENNGEGGCEIVLASWQVSEAAQIGAKAERERELAIIRHASEIDLRVDEEHRLLTVTSRASDALEAANAMHSGIGKPWTQFIELAGSTQHDPMHWRLLDGAEFNLAGSDRLWKVAIVPLGKAEQNPSGFELYFHSEEAPPPKPALLSRKTPPKPKAEAQIGREIAPVLRQPIARIIANAETIRSRLAGPISDEYSGYAADISAAGEHLLALIDDLADLEIVEAEGFSVAPDVIDLGDVARRAAGILGVRAQEKSIKIVTPQDNEKLAAIGEFRRVLQVLLNLLGNAISYSPEGSQIWLRLEDAGDMATITVADQGAGLSAEQQAHVFEKFERLGRSGDGGSGLGLYISRTLAAAMDGELSVESAPGQGARFTLAIPKLS